MERGCVCCSQMEAEMFLPSRRRRLSFTMLWRLKLAACLAHGWEDFGFALGYWPSPRTSLYPLPGLPPPPQTYLYFTGKRPKGIAVGARIWAQRRLQVCPSIFSEHSRGWGATTPELRGKLILCDCSSVTLTPPTSSHQLVPLASPEAA